MLRIIVAVILLLFLLTAVFGANIPQPQGLVNDYVSKLTPSEKRTLENKIATFQKDAQLIITIVPDMQGEEIAPFANQMFNTWGIGSKGINRGVLLLVAMKEHKIRIEVGYGFEGAFPDLKTKEVINKITPLLGQNKWFEAFDKAIDDIALISKKE